MIFFIEATNEKLWTVTFIHQTIGAKNKETVLSLLNGFYYFILGV